MVKYMQTNYKYADEEFYHVVSISDEFLIPALKEEEENTEEQSDK